MSNIIQEEYHSVATMKYPGCAKEFVTTVYVNPTFTDLKELYIEIHKHKDSDNLCSFLIYKNNLYIWSADFLHSNMIKHLKLKLDSYDTETIKIEDAFLGICQIRKEHSKLFFDDTNQQLNGEYDKVLLLYHSILEKYFSNIERIKSCALNW